jgi:hypothetical protein
MVADIWHEAPVVAYGDNESGTKFAAKAMAGIYGTIIKIFYAQCTLLAMRDENCQSLSFKKS